MKQLKFVQNNCINIRFIKSRSIVTLFVGVTMFLFSCTPNKVEEISEYIPENEMPVMSADTFEMVYSDSSVVRFKMKAPEVLNFKGENPHLEFPRGINIEKFNEKQEIVSVLSADYAKYLEKEAMWIAENNVIAINEDGDSLKTEELIWEEKGQRIFSDKYVKIIRDDQIINGIGFESDQDMTNWEIKKPTGVMYLDVDKK